MREEITHTHALVEAKTQMPREPELTNKLVNKRKPKTSNNPKKELVIKIS